MERDPESAQLQETSERVNAALEACGGSQTLAAKQLGWTKVAVSKALRRDQRLYRRWVKPSKQYDRIPREMTDAQTLERSARPVPELSGMSDEEREQWEVKIEDKEVINALMRIKLTPEEADLAKNLAEFHQHHLVTSMHIVGGGVTRACIVLQTQVDGAAKRLEFIRSELSKPDLDMESRKIYSVEEKIAGSLLIAASAELRQIFETATRGLSMMAAIRERVNKPKKAQLGKPGFQSTAEAEGFESPEERHQ